MSESDGLSSRMIYTVGPVSLVFASTRGRFNTVSWVFVIIESPIVRGRKIGEIAETINFDIIFSWIEPAAQQDRVD